MSKTTEFLAEIIKAYRKKEGLSQGELSEKTGVSEAQISEMERGIDNPTLSILEKIADHFQITVAEMLDAEDAINNQDRLKGVIREHIDQLDVKQLKMVLSLMRLARR